MNIVQHNLTAAAAANQQSINATNFQKTAKKLGSGYQINSAADNAAGLSISEKMRAQIRALNRSARNAEEGADFMLTGDGAMDEAHSILHRMSELTVQSLNDTNTPADRAALEAEFEQLQCELDRINDETYYNTLPVFEQHEPSFYQIAGNRVWASTQQHFVIAPDNSLNIHLPDDIYDPAEYTVTVPSGIYTTQELIDEIDSAIEAMDPKPALKDSKEQIVPGFIFEYTDTGYCNLNFESSNGLYTEMTSVDGGLAYLLYASYDSSNIPAGLLGTTYFAPVGPDGPDYTNTLPIIRGTNDTLTFYAESAGGLVSNQITLTIPEGRYTRDEMIGKLNELLAQTPGTDGIEAKPYGDAYVQLTGGATISITGLKGNMFQIDQGTNYSSVFYDNIDFGSIRSTRASFTGAAYYSPGYTDKIKIDGTNNTLRFTVDSNPANTIEFTIADGSYTMSQLASILNDGLRALGVASVTTSSAYVNFSGKYVSCQCLHLTSLASGSKIQFEFDTSDPVAEKTYNSLFVITKSNYTADPKSSSGSDGSYASITGYANLSASQTSPLQIDSADKTLTVKIDNASYTIDLQDEYTSMEDLTDAIEKGLNNQLGSGSVQKVTVTNESGNIKITGNSQIKEISVENSGAYEQLFTRTGTAAKRVDVIGKGEEVYLQGTTELKKFEMASVTLPEPIPADSTTINSTNNQLTFVLNSSYPNTTVTIPDGTYTRQQLVDEINERLDAQGINVQASLTNNCLTLTTTASGMDHPDGLYLEIDSNYGTAWKALLGTVETLLEPVPNRASDGAKAYLQGAKSLGGSVITIDDSNNIFTLNFAGASYQIKLDGGTYTAAGLCNELQRKINSIMGITDAADTEINVFITNSGCIRFEAVQAGVKNLTVSAGSGFYQQFLQDEITNEQPGSTYKTGGTYTFDEAFIVGRSEIKGKTVSIIEGVNNIFKIDLTYPDPSDTRKTLTKTLTVSLASGAYDNQQLTSALNAGMAAALRNAGIYEIGLSATIGGHHNGNVTGVNDQNVLQISIVEKTDANGNKIEATPGSYCLDGIRGSAAYTLFYKTAGTAEPIYIIGTKDVSKGVTFTSKNNELSIKVDGTPYTITYPEPASYTDEELILITNKLLDDKGIPIEASLENGRVKFTHKEYADQKDHTISDVSGSASGTVFYATNNRDHLDAFMLQVGALGHQGLELPRFSISTTSLGINSIIITKPKYANKALGRLSKALDLLSAKRSTYGALTNRIDHVVANNENTSENVQASESRIRDADMADEMVSLTKHRILLQASQAMLAQANQTPNNILTLLQ